MSGTLVGGCQEVWFTGGSVLLAFGGVPVGAGPDSRGGKTTGLRGPGDEDNGLGAGWIRAGTSFSSPPPPPSAPPSHGSPLHLTPTSSLCWQLLVPNGVRNLHASSPSSCPSHCTSSSSTAPLPLPYAALGTASAALYGRPMARHATAAEALVNRSSHTVPLAGRRAQSVESDEFGER